MKDKIIEIDSFNPYEAIFPQRKVVTKDTLKLIKTLRTEGYDVIVKPNGNRPIEYLFKKGETSFLSDPAIQLVISVPVSIITGLITNWIQNKLSKEKSSNNILIIDNSSKLIINGNNKKIAKGELSDRKKKNAAINKTFEDCLKTKSPIPGLPVPILLEHKPIIVGWCRLQDTERGLELEKGIIVDKNVYRKMQKGKYQGGSITGIAKVSTCTICNSDYVNCNHIAGELYEGEICANQIVEMDLIEVSIVTQPINTQAFIKLL